MSRLSRPFLIFSLLLNLLLAGGIAFMLHRLGGWKYALHRFRSDEAGLYAHRKSLFEQLPEKKGSIVFLGDSQIEQCEWRELCGDTLPILNRGITGDHVDGVLARLPETLRHRPSKIFLCVGVNDLILGKPMLEIEGRYRQIVQQIRRETPDAQLFVQSVLPLNNKVKRIGIENGNIRDLNLRLAQIAEEYAVPFVDIHAQLTDAQGNLAAKFTDDGLHLNGAGYLVWKKNLEPFLKF
jgi:lysophospholipase L1-like esterase